jgi:hypothetical protein
MIRKYFSNINANGFSKSNIKVGGLKSNLNQSLTHALQPDL